MSPFFIVFLRKEINIMKKNSIYYLLINTMTAMNKIGINNSGLAHFIGVDTKSVSRWFNNKRTPNDLNQYKLNWFVYLVLNKGLTASDIIYKYSLKDLSLYTNPYGKGHYEPWNEEDEDPFDPEDFVSYDHYDDLDHENCKDCEFFDECMGYEDYEDFDDDDHGFYPELDTLNDMLKARNEIDLTELGWLSNETVEEVFDLSDCTYQEALRRIDFLSRLLENYVDEISDQLDISKTSLFGDYVRVKDYDSFITFLNTFKFVTEVDERFDTTKDGFELSLSRYNDPALKSVNKVEVFDVYSDDNGLHITCLDGKKYQFKDDGNFAINTFGTHKLPDLDFIIRYKGEYYSLSIKFDMES